MLGELRALEFLHAELGEVIDIISDRGDPSALPSTASGFAPLGSAATGAANREKTEQNRGRLKKILHAVIADLRKPLANYASVAWPVTVRLPHYPRQST